MLLNFLLYYLGSMDIYSQVYKIFNHLDNGKSFEKQIELLLKHLAISSNTTIYCIFNCLMKFVNIKSDLRMQAIPVYEQYLENWDPELQQRAIEYILLCKLDGEDSNIPNVAEVRYIYIYNI